jgi:hypothetical protein
MFFRDDEDVGVEPQRKESLVTFDSDPRMIVSSLSTVASLRTLSRLLRIEN